MNSIKLSSLAALLSGVALVSAATTAQAQTNQILVQNGAHATQNDTGTGTDVNDNCLLYTSPSPRD